MKQRMASSTTSTVDVVPLMKTAGVVENSGHCIYSTGLKCFLNCLSLFHLVFYLLQSNTRYFVNHLERSACHYESLQLIHYAASQ